VRIRLVVGLLTAALIVYFWLLADRAVALLTSGTAAGIALGIGVLLLPVLGVVVVAFELRFGWQTETLGRRLAAGGGLPDDSELPRRPSGRVDRDAADAHFEIIRGQLEAAPEDWRGWYRLAHAYDLAGDRKRARSAMRHAIELAHSADGPAGAD
jgi:cytochrome c-type biogenesis protein CcmH/NrfG